MHRIRGDRETCADFLGRRTEEAIFSTKTLTEIDSINNQRRLPLSAFQFVVDQISSKRDAGTTITLRKTPDEVNAACLTEEIAMSFTDGRNAYKVGGLVDVCIEPCSSMKH
jgi:hypothetical protein